MNPTKWSYTASNSSLVRSNHARRLDDDNYNTSYKSIIEDIPLKCAHVVLWMCKMSFSRGSVLQIWKRLHAGMKYVCKKYIINWHHSSPQLNHPFHNEYVFIHWEFSTVLFHLIDVKKSIWLSFIILYFFT